MKIEEPLVYSRPEQRAIIVQALGIFPNVWVVYNYVGKRIGVSYGSIWNIARAEGIELIRFDRRRLPKREVIKFKMKRKNSPSVRRPLAASIRRNVSFPAPHLFHPSFGKRRVHRWC